MALRSLLRRSLLDTPLEPLARALYTALAPTQAARYDRQLNAVIRRVPQPIPALPVAKDPQLPGLVLGIEVATEVVRVGDPITITLFLINRAAAPADDLVLTLPVPDGARALTNGKPTPQLRSWSWNLGTLPGQQSVSVTATLQLTRMPQGEALLLTPEATARGLAAPVRAEGGALVDERVPQALPQGDGGDSVAPATTIATPAEDPPTPFLPSKPVVLRSPRGRVAISVPGDASKQPLQLRYRFADAVLPELLAARQPLPPAEPNRRRSLGIFFLDARDDQGRAVHQFDRPLTFSIGYTDEQLRVLGINPGALRLFWFDPARSSAQPDGSTRLGAWVPVEATLDVVARTMTAQVDHFSAFALGNGNSPSSTYLPSLQGWQVSDYTGAASFAYPFDVPAGPGGLKPSLALSYSSNAPDGPGGVGEKLQASWVGRGWSLDPGGAIARNKNPCCGDYDSFTLTAMGRSFDFVRGNPINGSTNTFDLSAWEWHTVDESYWKITAGANDTWTVWAPDGTRYDYTRPLRWGWKGDPGKSDTYETYKWLLTAVVDPSGNKLVFSYAVEDWNPYGQVINPTYRLSTISWGYDGVTPGTGTARYQLDFAASSRWAGHTSGVDLKWDYAANQIGTQPGDTIPDHGRGAPHEAYRLDSVTLSSLVPGVGMRAVRAWTLSYAATAASVRTDAYNEGTGAPNGQPMLTLLGIQERGATLSTTPVWSYLPATTFTYGMSRGTGLAPTPGWNRLVTADNGYGGRTTYTYQHVWAPPGNSDGTPLPSGESYAEGFAYAYRFRVRSMLQQDVSGQAYAASVRTVYDYVNPALNTRGQSAMVWYDRYPAPGGNGTPSGYLAHEERTEFRGHESVVTRVFNGATTNAPLLQRTQTWFYQGKQLPSGCTPSLVAVGSLQAVDTSSAATCFQDMLRNESWKGRAYQEETQDVNGVALQRVECQ